jgi:hypothetical protein
MKAGVMLTVSFLALGTAGCAGSGRNLAGGSIAASQSIAATPPQVSFVQADSNGDARITRQEFDLWRRSSGASDAQAAAGGTGEQDAFAAADSNANDVLTLDEWQAMTNPASRERLAQPRN